MEQEKAYLKNILTLLELAEMVFPSQNYLLQEINEQLQMDVFGYVTPTASKQLFTNP